MFSRNFSQTTSERHRLRDELRRSRSASFFLQDAIRAETHRELRSGFARRDARGALSKLRVGRLRTRRSEIDRSIDRRKKEVDRDHLAAEYEQSADF